jgi:tRNA threonylcarbamoyl adenosine modification protein YeaZ
MILAIDSSLGTSVAVIADTAHVLSSCHSADPRGHAETIGALVDQALRDAGISASDVTGVAMGTGPGGFTGLRVGMAAAEAFALPRSLPVYPIVSHDALGWESDHEAVVITDARRGELAYSVYSPDSSMRRIAGPALSTPAELDSALGTWANLPRIEGVVLDAGALGRVALSMLASGLEFPSRSPMYLRVPDVTVAP